MELHKIEISSPTGNPEDVRVLLDGQPVRGLVSISFSVQAGWDSTARVSMVLESRVEAGFEYMEHVFRNLPKTATL